MRRRLFWTIAGVAAITGVLVLLGVTLASQRAAIEATKRELAKSSEEVVSIINDTVDQAGQRPGAVIELLRLLEGDLRPTMGRIRRTAGSSELAFAAITAEGELRANASLFQRVEIDMEPVESGTAQFLRSTDDELVMITPTSVVLGDTEFVLLVGMAREAPVVRVADMGAGLLLVGAGIALLSAVLARVLSGQLARRLEPLSVASRDLAAGDLTARVPELGDPDLDGVGRAFNEMAAEIETTRDREREFILGVGHDLRTPLTTIGGYSEALEAGEVDPDEVARIGSVLGTQTRQMGRLIEDLTLLARLEQPEFGLRTEEVDVGAHVSEVVEGFRRHASDVGVTLGMEATGDTVVTTDPERLGQIVQNLVENALRFTPETGRVDVSVAGSDGGVDLVVADSGVGIEQDDLPHIFDHHYVGRQRRIRDEGSGLGLSIVKGLAERLGGTVSAESSPGRGTTVTVNLPRDD